MENTNDTKEILNNDQSVRDITNVELLSNEELIDRIENMFSDNPEKQLDVEILEKCLAVLQKRAPVAENYSVDSAWEKLQDDHPLLFEPIEVTDAHTMIAAHRVRIVSRIVAVFVAILCSLAITASAFGWNPIQKIINWGKEFFVLNISSGNMELPSNSDYEFSSLFEALKKDGFSADFLPTWIPSDFSIISAERYAAASSITYLGWYKSERGNLFIDVTVSESQTVQATYEKDDGGYTYTHNGTEFLIYTNTGYYCAVWKYDGFLCGIDGSLTERELIRMIDSIPFT